MLITKTEKIQLKRVKSSRSEKNKIHHDDMCKITIYRFLGIPICRFIVVLENERGPGKHYATSIRF